MTLKATVLLSGARDYYQLPLALYEGGMLQALVTDVYWHNRTMLELSRLLPEHLRALRYDARLAGANVRLSYGALAAWSTSRLLPSIDLNWYRNTRISRLGKRIALGGESTVFAYSYLASSAFTGDDVPARRFLFQLHPHPKSVRALLLEEMQRVPAARTSLMKEEELALSAAQFRLLADEPRLANGWTVASSYTAGTLIEHSVKPDTIHVVPYGVDSGRFPQRRRSRPLPDIMTVLFVGQMAQRKGLSYLLEAIRRLKTRRIRMILAGRGVIDQLLLSEYHDIPMEVRVNLSLSELVTQFHNADIFVLPSLAEGFGHVILEAMSTGLPVIATEHTCAPDVLKDGVHGFIVPIRDSESIAEKLAWGMDNRAQLADMGECAAHQARHFTWDRFRAGIRAAYEAMVRESLTGPSVRG